MISPDIITVALSEDGVLKGVDEVQRGKACRCSCPACGAPMEAVQGDVRVHHFRHQPGYEACDWAIDAIVQRRVKKAIATSGVFGFPRLRYRDDVQSRNVTASEGRPMRVSLVGSEKVTGRRVPALIVRVTGKNGAEKRYAVLGWLIHKPSDAQMAALREVVDGFVGLDFSRAYRDAVRHEGKHTDRVSFVEQLQSAEYIEENVRSERATCKRWLFNRKADELERRAAQRKKSLQEERRGRAEQRKREESQKAEEEALLAAKRRQGSVALKTASRFGMFRVVVDKPRECSVEGDNEVECYDCEHFAGADRANDVLFCTLAYDAT